jgi:hypothetical protein
MLNEYGKIGKPNGHFSAEDPYSQDELLETNVPAHTLGTMLRAFGVDDDVFGWDDEAEDFTMSY